MIRKKQHEKRLTEFFNVFVGELNGLSTENAAKRFAIDRQVQRARKRAEFSRPELKRAAIASFLKDNEAVGSHRVCLPPDIVRDARHFITTVLERFTTNVDGRNIQVTLDPAILVDLWKFGPGASNGVEGTHTAQKLVQPMTCTAQCEPLVKLLRQSNPYLAAFDAVEGGGTTVVTGSRLTTVLKNEDQLRTITIGPSGNMALQLAAGAYLASALRMIGLDISNQQPKNKKLAEAGSSFDHIATIDLHSASNFQGTTLVRLLWPMQWVKLLMAIREDVVTIGRETHQLNMISAMGCGFTFPLMTMTIVSLIYAMRRQKNGPVGFIDWTKTAVFGDDIAVPVHEYAELVDLLTRAGFVVNLDKSYASGPFRESCGGDYYDGYDVTPIYVRRLRCDSDIFNVINQIQRWCGKHQIYLPRTLVFLVKALEGKCHLVPEWKLPTEGVQTSGCPKRYKYLQMIQHRWKYIHDHRFAMMLVCGGYLESPPVKRAKKGENIGSIVPGQDATPMFLPRPKKLRWKVKSARLPKGYLTGWDPSLRSEPESNWLSGRLQVLLSMM